MEPIRDVLRKYLLPAALLATLTLWLSVSFMETTPLVKVSSALGNTAMVLVTGALAWLARYPDGGDAWKP